LEYYKIIEHRGSINYETIGELIHELKRQVHLLGIQMATYKRLLLVMIEVLENLLKHNELPKYNNSSLHFSPLFNISRDDNKYIVRASNTLRSVNCQVLSERIEYLNTLNQQGLKELYKDTITRAGFNEQGGAGLGLIEMTKISHSGLQYTFLPIDGEFVQFNLIIEIDL